MSDDPTSTFGRARPRGPVGMVAALWLVVLTLLAVLAPLVGFIRSPDEKIRVGGQLQSRYRLGPGRDALFGTDNLGMDVFAKCIHFARNSLLVGVSATLIGLLVGGALGVTAGYFRGWVDRVISILIDALLSIPALVLAILLISRIDDIKQSWSFLGWFNRTAQVIAALSILAIGPLARIVRARTIALREQEFIVAARSLGAGSPRIIVHELLPNLVPTMVTVAFTGLGLLIAAEGTLSFLGVGLGESWGVLIDENRQRMDRAWWATVFPCLMLFLTVMAFNLIGDRLAKRFDIREAGV